MKLFLSVVTLATLLILCSLAAHAQLAGGSTYPINGTENPPTSFATVKSAAAYLNANGVTGTGNVTLEIMTGYAGETDTVGIRAIPGADSTRRVIFRPAAGFTAVSSIAGLASPNQHTIRLAGASYVTLDGRAGGTGNSRDWTVRCTGTNGQMAVRLDNNSGSMTGIVIRNLIMEAEAASTTGAIFQITGNTTNTLTNVTVEQNLIRSNPGAGTFRGYGITIATASNVANTGLIIRNNVLNQFYGRGINLTGGFPGAKISGNDIFHTAVVTQAVVTEFAGIYMSTSTSGGTEIHNNFIHDIQLANGTTGANGIQTLTLNTAGNPLKVYNNRIQIGAGIQGTTFPIHGIYQGGSVTGYLFDVFYNSVYIGGSATAGTANSAAFRKASSNFMNVSNNVFYNARSNSGGTGVHWGIMVNNTTIATISNNDYFADGSGGVLGTHTGAATGNDSTLAQWYAAVTSDVSSVNQNPNYLNPTATPPDLHLNAVTPTQLESGAIPIAGIITDFDGDVRSAATPDIGSDEGTFTPLDLTPPAISYIALGNTTAGTVQTLTATVIDPSGVPTAGTGRPVAYWKRNTGGTYAGATGTFVSSDNFTFSFGAGTVTGDTVFYFVAAQDSNNNVGVSPSLGAGGFTPNPPAASTPPTNPSWYVIRPTLAGGSYTVGTTSGTYQTLKAAFDAINGSIVTGNITLSVLSQGTSESATAELSEVSSGPGGPFVITVKPATSSSPTITGSIPGFLVKFSGADNVTIDGANTVGGTTRNLTLSNTAMTTNTGVVWVGSLGEGAGASNITIKNVNIIAGRNDTTNTLCIYAATADTITSSGTGADNNNLLIENNNFQRARFAVYSRGALPTGIQTGLMIRNNVMGSDSSGYEISYRAVDVGNSAAPQIVGNRIFNMTQPLGFTVEGIHLDVNVSDAMISRNSIYKLRQTNTGTYGAIGVNISSTTGSLNVTIANNIIANLSNDGGGTSTASNPFGIRIVGGSNHKIYYNSVHLAGQFQNLTTGDLSAALIITSSSASGLDIRNNIFSNSMSGGSGTKCYGIYAVSASTVFGTIDRNDYYVEGANGVLGRQGSTDVTDLAGWRAFTSKDSNSVSGKPFFVDTLTNLHIDSAQVTVVSNAGAPVAGITTDIDGQTRHASTPDIGADEFGAALPPLGWTVQTSGTTQALRCVKALDRFNGWIGGAGGTVLRTTNGGTTWSSVGGGPMGTNTVYAIEALSPTTAFVTTSPTAGTYIFRSTNGGTSWDTVFSQAGGFLDGIKMFDATNGIAIGDAVGGTWTILTTSNGGSTWARTATEPVQAGTESGYNTSISAVGSRIWFGTNNSRVYYSTDGRTTWNFSVTAFAASVGVGFLDANYGVAGGSSANNAAARSIDGGVTWNPVTMPGLGSIYGIIGKGTDFWAGRNTLVLHSGNRGLTWDTSYAGSIGAFRHLDFVWQGNNAYGWAATATGGIAYFAGTLTGVDDHQEGAVPQQFALQQNYPNPFNPTTTIRYALPEAAHVNLSIYNVLGQRVAELTNEVQNAGYYNVIWNGRNQSGSQVATGVYFYRIEATPNGSAPFVSLKKMLLLK